MAADVYLTAGLWIVLALGASLISVRIGVSVALLEIGMGILGGNVLHLSVTTWINFLASFGSVLGSPASCGKPGQGLLTD